MMGQIGDAVPRRASGLRVPRRGLPQRAFPVEASRAGPPARGRPRRGGLGILGPVLTFGLVGLSLLVSGVTLAQWFDSSSPPGSIEISTGTLGVAIYQGHTWADGVDSGDEADGPPLLAPGRRLELVYTGEFQLSGDNMSATLEFDLDGLSAEDIDLWTGVPGSPTLSYSLEIDGEDPITASDGSAIELPGLTTGDAFTLRTALTGGAWAEQLVADPANSKGEFSFGIPQVTLRQVR